jgi:signal transduction histidine kinase/HAMP domain-containing protein
MKFRLQPRGLSFKIIAVIFANVVIITAGIFLYIYQISRDTILDNLKENSRLLTVSTVRQVEKVLTSVQKMPENLSKVVESRDFSASELTSMLTRAVEDNDDIYGAAISFESDYAGKGNEFATIYVYKDSGKVRTRLVRKDDRSFSIQDWYLIPKQLRKSLWSEPYYDEGFGNIVMSTYSVPLFRTVRGEKKFIGVITADLSLDWLDKIVSSIRVYQSGYAFMISRTGCTVAHPRKEFIMNESIFSVAAERNSSELREIGKRMIQGESSFAETEYHNAVTNKVSWVSYAPVKVNGWSLGIFYPVEELTAPLHKLFQVVLILAVIGGLVLLLAVVLVSNSITRPLRQLAAATRTIALGSFEAPLPSITTRDEIGELTGSFSAMQAELKETIDQLRNANEELEQHSKTLEDKVEARTAELRVSNAQLDQAFENVKTLSEIGREITSTLDLEVIFTTVYQNVNKLLDASSFLIMVYNEKEQLLECKAAIEKDERLPGFNFSTTDKNRFAVWCFDNKRPVFINDVDVEFSKYVATRSKPKAGEYVSSLIYLPLMVGGKIIGVISTQSFRKHAYTEAHLDILNNLANYTAIALDNAFAYESVHRANRELKEAQNQLVQSEKMASLGQLTAGIAHEIKNPLNFINNFAELSIDLTKELVEEIDKIKAVITPATAGIMTELLNDLEHNVTKINEHGKRADSIVKGMLLHSRGKSGEKQKSNLNELLAEDLNLVYHGFRAQDSSFNVKMVTDYDPSLAPVNVVPQNISRVFLNILNNACYSLNEKTKERGGSYSPTLSVTTKDLGERVEVRIRDNGKGIPDDILAKVFNPFFTTKPTGKGTGLGLSLSYDIVVQEHKGELKVLSEPGEYAEFIITLPKSV